jgi:hypothetical protein
MQILNRLGSFFILAGLVLLVLFVGSVISKDIKTVFLLTSIGTFFIGFLFQRNKPASASGRFAAIRRASANSRQRREEKKNKKQKNSHFSHE